MVFINNILNKFNSDLFYADIKELEQRNLIINFIFENVGAPTPEYISLNDVESHNNVYYPIVNLREIFITDNIDEDVFGITLRNLILNNDVKVIFFDVNESHCFAEFKVLNDYLLKYNIPQENIFLFYNNTKLNEYKQILNSKINVYCSQSIMIEHSRILQKNKVKYLDNDKQFLFMCLNLKMHRHRVVNLAILHNNNLLNDIDYSCIIHHNDFFNESKLSNESYLKYKDSINHILSISDKKSYFESKGKVSVDSNETNFKTFENSYFNLVTETDFDLNVLHPTEKSLKPFYYFQYPLFVAPPHHVKYLKDTYGFDMFDDIINHSYDDEIHDLKRMDMIHSEILKIFNNSNFYKEIYKEHKNRFISNHNLVCDITNNTSDVSYIKSKLTKGGK